MKHYVNEKYGKRNTRSRSVAKIQCRLNQSTTEGGAIELSLRVKKPDGSVTDWRSVGQDADTQDPEAIP